MGRLILRKILAFNNDRRVDDWRHDRTVNQRHRRREIQRRQHRRRHVLLDAHGQVLDSTRRRVVEVLRTRTSRHEDGRGAKEQTEDLNWHGNHSRSRQPDAASHRRIKSRAEYCEAGGDSLIETYLPVLHSLRDEIGVEEAAECEDGHVGEPHCHSGKKGRLTVERLPSARQRDAAASEFGKKSSLFLDHNLRLRVVDVVETVCFARPDVGAVSLGDFLPIFPRLFHAELGNESMHARQEAVLDEESDDTEGDDHDRAAPERRGHDERHRNGCGNFAK